MERSMYAGYSYLATLVGKYLGLCFLWNTFADCVCLAVLLCKRTDTEETEAVDSEG